MQRAADAAAMAAVRELTPDSDGAQVGVEDAALHPRLVPAVEARRADVEVTAEYGGLSRGVGRLQVAGETLQPLQLATVVVVIDRLAVRYVDRGE